MNRYFSVNEYFRKRFGCKVYKIALSADFSCPNRQNGNRGCIFCSAGGSGEFAERIGNDPMGAVARAIARVSQKGATAFVAYFQSYTNTYAPVSVLEQTFAPLLKHPSVVALSIATRPDCLDEDVLALLKKLNARKPVFVELGLQTANDRVADFIRRGYPSECYCKAMQALRKAGIETVTHLIVGLPGESKADVLRSVDYAVAQKTSGIKLHLLQVLQNTDLAKLYIKGEYRPWEKEEYLETVAECLRRIPPSVVIHRLTGDPPKKILTAPAWCADKKRVLVDLARYLDAHGIIQGSDCR